MGSRLPKSDLDEKEQGNAGEYPIPPIDGFIGQDTTSAQIIPEGDPPSTEKRSKEAQRPPLSRIITGRSATSFVDPGPPPDGGVTAWTQAFMALLVLTNSWGWINSFGVFQTYYTSTLGHPPSDISWIGSVQTFLLFFIGTFSGRATDAGLFRPVFIAGLCLHLIGVFTTSVCTKYWQLFLAQGVCTGIGNGLQFCPTMSLLSTYFSTNRSLAIGIAASGTGVGGIIFPIIIQQLLPRIGFGWTVRALGFIMTGIGALTIAFLKTRIPPRKSGPIIEWAAFKENTYRLYLIGMFLNFWALYFAFFYVSESLACLHQHY